MTYTCSAYGSLWGMQKLATSLSFAVAMPCQAIPAIARAGLWKEALFAARVCCLRGNGRTMYAQLPCCSRKLTSSKDCRERCGSKLFIILTLSGSLQCLLCGASSDVLSDTLSASSVRSSHFRENVTCAAVLKSGAVFLSGVLHRASRLKQLISEILMWDSCAMLMTLMLTTLSV